VTRLRLLLQASVLFTVSGCGGDHFSSSTGTRGGSSGAAGASGGRDEGEGGSGGDSGGTAEAGGFNDDTGGSTSTGGAETSGGRGNSGRPGSGGGDGSAGTIGKGGSSSTGGTASSGGSSSGGVMSSSGGMGAGSGGTGGKGAGGATMLPPHFCDGQQAALFCDDFDGITTIDTLLASWTSVSTTGGTFYLDTGTGVPSPPNALQLRTNSSQDVQALAIHEAARFAKAPSKVRLEFNLRIDAADTVGIASGAAIATLLTGSRIFDGMIGIEVAAGPALHAGYIDPSGTPDDVPFSTPFPAEGKWLDRYAIEVTYSTTAAGTRTACLQVYVGTARQLPQCMPLPRSLATPPPFMSVALGVLGGGLATTGDVQVRFDNVVVTAQ
jgi:hypothetical protein